VNVETVRSSGLLEELEAVIRTALNTESNRGSARTVCRAENVAVLSGENDVNRRDHELTIRFIAGQLADIHAATDSKLGAG
jgi:hypothetical protein